MTDKGKHSRQLGIMKATALLPGWLWRPTGNVIIAVLVAKKTKPVRQWQLNYEVMAGDFPTQAQTRRAFKLWMENFMVSLQLGRWSEKKIRSRVVLDNPENWRQLLDLHDKGGVVTALPHMGSWDLVGAFACLEGLPVSSVAEALSDGLFEYFRKLREELGLRIYSVRDRKVFEKLRADLVTNHRAACLVADRDFSRRGLPVRWHTSNGDRNQTMPPGPALLARQSGRPLVGVSTWFGPKNRLYVRVSESITVEEGEDGLHNATQALADFFCEQIQAHPLDWHMLQRFFQGVTP